MGELGYARGAAQGLRFAFGSFIKTKNQTIQEIQLPGVPKFISFSPNRTASLDFANDASCFVSTDGTSGYCTASFYNYKTLRITFQHDGIMHVDFSIASDTQAETRPVYYAMLY